MSGADIGLFILGAWMVACCVVGFVFGWIEDGRSESRMRRERARGAAQFMSELDDLAFVLSESPSEAEELRFVARRRAISIIKNDVKKSLESAANDLPEKKK